MMAAAITFTYVKNPLAVALIVMAILAVVAFVYRSAFRGAAGMMPLLLAALRGVTVLGLLILILRPVISYDRVERTHRRVAILLDRSRSMSIRDSVGDDRRFDSAITILRGEPVARLKNLYRLEAYAFGTEAERRPLDRLGEIVPDSEGTDLGAGWNSIEAGEEKIEAIVILSDGRDPRHREILAGSRLPAQPVHAVVLGSGGDRIKDIAVLGVEGERKVLLGNRTEIRVKIASRGYEGLRGRLEMSRGDEVVSSREIPLSPGTREVVIPFTPRTGGRHIYRFAVEPRQDEISAENNVRHHEMEVSEKPIRVLMYDTVRWEYGRIRRQLEGDPDLGVTCVVKIREDVILQQGSSPVPLAGGLPEGRGNFKAFDVIVLGDLVPEDFKLGQLDALKLWVGEDGGGLILTGGPRLFGDGGLARSPLEDALPVALPAPDSGAKVLESRESGLLVEPTLIGVGHPVTQGVLPFFRVDREGGAFTIQRAFAIGHPKPGAVRVLTARAPGTESRRDILVLQTYGAGRSAVYAVDSGWSWVMKRGREGGEQLFGLIWGQLIRWAANRSQEPSGPGLRLPKRVWATGDEVPIEIGGGEGLDRAEGTATGPGGTKSPIEIEIEMREEGRLRGRYVPRTAGRHAIEIQAGGEVLRDEITVESSTAELENPEPDPDLLREIAERTGGRFYRLVDAHGLADNIIRQSEGSVTHVRITTEKDTIYLLFILMVAALTLEWFLRRRIYII